MDKKNETANKIKTKIRSSLVLRLNFQMIGRLISSFFIINILIAFTVFFVLVWKAEEGAYSIIKILSSYQNPIESITTTEKYEVLIKDKPNKGFKFPSSMQEYLPAKSYDVRRSFKISEDYKKASLKNKLYSIRYILELPIGNSYYQVIYLLGLDFKLFLGLFFPVLIFQLIFIINSARKGYRNIKKTLQPIAELSKAAQDLNAEVSSRVSSSQGSQIKDLAGAISNIDANKLDSHISIDSSQDELKDLASSINSMLNRVNDSYQSQIRFVSDASHELRTPISVIQGYANLLDRWGKNDEKTLDESIEAIKSEAGNMKDLIEQLLFLARGDNETIQLHKEVFDCCEIMDEIIRETQMIDDNHDFQIQLDRPAFINADRQLLKQAIRILMDNSIKFTPLGEKIILKVTKDNSIKIIVQDSGIGIEGKDLPYIFDRFYRSDESRARKTGGSGLGLSIAKWIIERHGAYFEIVSRIDIGTRITMVFDKIKEGPPSP